MEKLTLLITCTNRVKTLLYSIPYYKKYNINFHILDSSNDESNINDIYNILNLKKNENYFYYSNNEHFPIYGMFCYHLKNIVKSKYIAWVADDDLMTYEGLKMGVDFLEQSKEYVFTSGLQVFTNSYKYGECCYCKNDNDNNDDVISRLNNNFKNIMTGHGIILTDIWFNINNLIETSYKLKNNSSLTPIRFHDKIIQFIILLHGKKNMQLPIVSLIRTHKFERMINSNNYPFPCELERNVDYNLITERLKIHNPIAIYFCKLHPSLTLEKCNEITLEVLGKKYPIDKPNNTYKNNINEIISKSKPIFEEYYNFYKDPIIF